MSTLENDILQIAQQSISKAIISCLTEYSGPLRKLCEKVMTENEPALYAMINGEVASLISSNDFRKELREALNAKLARLLIERIGGEVEKRVNELKADPVTRAKITLAIQSAISP